MADTKISALTTATLPLVGTEVLPIVQSSSTKKIATDDLTVKNIRSNATTGILQVAGPVAGATRVMTVPNANFSAARTDAAQTFTGRQSINGALGLSSILEGYSTSYETLAAFRSVPNDGINPYFLITSSANGITLEQNGSAYRSLILKTGAADRVTVAAGGDVTVNTGNLIQGTAAKGVTTGGAFSLGLGTNGSTTQATLSTTGILALASGGAVQSPIFRTSTQTGTGIVSGANNDFPAIDIPVNSVFLVTVKYVVSAGNDGTRSYIVAKQSSGAGSGVITSQITDFSAATSNIVATLTNNGSDTIVRVVVTTTAAGGSLTVSSVRIG